MSTVADLEYCLARCNIPQESPETAELLICEPASEGSTATSISIMGLDAIIALRNCIDEEVARLESRLELARQDVPQ